MDIGCYFYFKLVYFILFCLVNFCTTNVGEIYVINNVDEHPIVMSVRTYIPQYGAMKNIRLKTGCHVTPLFTKQIVCTIVVNSGVNLRPTCSGRT